MKIISNKEIYKILDVRKRITKLSFSEEEFNQWINTINAINALPEGSTCFNGQLLTSFQIPNIFADLILPEKVGLSESRDCVNLIEEIKVNAADKVLTASEFTDISVSILGSLKKDISQVSGIERKVVVLSHIIERTEENGNVHSDECVPITLNVGPFHKPFYYAVNAQEAIQNWVRLQVSERTQG